jgi:ribonuclease HI
MDTGEVLLEHAQAIGEATNNEAEYSALIFALYQAERWNAEELEVRCDSKLIVNQTNGVWMVHNNHLREYAAEVATTVGRMLHGCTKSIKVKWVPRAENSDADKLTRVLRKKPEKKS